MTYIPPSPTEARLIFDEAYVPSSSSSADLVLGYTFETDYVITQIWHDLDYIYASTSYGLYIYDLQSEQTYAYATYSGGLTSIWGNEDKLFVGTASGIKYIDKTCISGSVISPYDLSYCFKDFSWLVPYTVTSGYIRYLHGNGDKILCISNTSVDIYKMGLEPFSSTSSESNAYKGFMTSTNKFYYTVSGIKWSIDVINNCFDNWTYPDYRYITGSGILAADLKINDIFVTENTSRDNISNTLFVATTSGAYVIDEGTEEYVVYYKE